MRVGQLSRRRRTVWDDAQDRPPGRRAPEPAAGRATTPPEEHRRHQHARRRADSRDRWTDQRQAPGAGLPGQRPWRLGPQPPARRGGDEGRLPPRPTGLSTLAAGPGRPPGHRLGRHRRAACLLRGPRLEPGPVRPVRHLISPRAGSGPSPRRLPGRPGNPFRGRRRSLASWPRPRPQQRRSGSQPSGPS